MRDRNRAALCNLLFKQRNNAAVAANHVSKAHGHIFGLRMVVICLDNHFTDTLGRTHNIRRVDCLIRRNHDKPAHMVPVRCLHDLPGTEHVVFDSLVRACLHQRHMLVCCCVVYNIRLVLCKNIVNALGIAHRRNQRHQIQLWKTVQQLLLDIVGRIFINIHNHKLFRIVRGNLAAQLASYRAAPACDHYHLSRHISHNGIQVDFHRVAPEQVIHVHVF